MNFARIKQAGLCLTLLMMTMGTSSPYSETDDPLSWTNLLGLGSCMQEAPIKVPAQEFEGLKLTNNNPRYEAQVGYPVAVSFLATGGQAPLYAEFFWSDGTSQRVAVNMSQTYAAATHTYNKALVYHGTVILWDSQERNTSAEFVVTVSSKR